MFVTYNTFCYENQLLDTKANAKGLVTSYTRHGLNEYSDDDFFVECQYLCRMPAYSLEVTGN